MSSTTRVIPGAPVPDFGFKLAGGGDWRLSAAAPRFMLMLEVFRGYHCPRCRRHLEALSAMKSDFDAAGLDIVAVSMDGEDKATATRGEWAMDDLPLGYGLAREDAETLGCYISQSIRDGESDVFAEPGVFFIRPDGTLFGAVLGTFPFVRPAPADLLEVGKIVAERDYPPRGTLPPLALAA